MGTDQETSFYVASLHNQRMLCGLLWEKSYQSYPAVNPAKYTSDQPVVIAQCCSSAMNVLGVDICLIRFKASSIGAGNYALYYEPGQNPVTQNVTDHSEVVVLF